MDSFIIIIVLPKPFAKGFSITYSKGEARVYFNYSGTYGVPMAYTHGPMYIHHTPIGPIGVDIHP